MISSVFSLHRPQIRVPLMMRESSSPGFHKLSLTDTVPVPSQLVNVAVCPHWETGFAYESGRFPPDVVLLGAGRPELVDL